MVSSWQESPITIVMVVAPRNARQFDFNNIFDDETDTLIVELPIPRLEIVGKLKREIRCFCNPLWRDTVDLDSLLIIMQDKAQWNGKGYWRLSWPWIDLILKIVSKPWHMTIAFVWSVIFMSCHCHTFLFERNHHTSYAVLYWCYVNNSTVPNIVTLNFIISFSFKNFCSFFTWYL